MKARALILGIVVSVVLLGIAGALYLMAAGGAERQYRDAVSHMRQIQQLSSQWSVEIARVKSDPLADFDSLAAFIPRMGRLKQSLADIARGTPELPERLASDINAYLAALAAKEERIERFKTGYAVVRNSVRYLPLAGANVTRQAQELGAGALGRSIAVLMQDMNLYLANPTETAHARLSEELQRVREESVTQPPAFANALANLASHAEVLLEKQGPTEELFATATSNEIADFTERLVSSVEFELARQATRSAWYERGMLGVILALALFWVGLAVQQRARGAAPAAAPAPAPVRGDAETERRRPALAESPAPQPSRSVHAREESARDEEEDLHAAVLAEAEKVPEVAEREEKKAPARRAPAPVVSEAGKSLDNALLHSFLARSVADSLAASASRIATRMDYLGQTQSRIQQALSDNDVLLPTLEEGADLDEEMEAAGAIASSVRREMNGLADLARRLSTFAAMPNGTLDRDMIDLNECVEEALQVTGAEQLVTVARRLGQIPEIFAARAEIRLLLTQVIENSVLAVQGLESRTGTIKVDTARRNDDILVTVIDNGAGIGAERRAKIFRPFYTSREGAMGLGLTLANYIAAKYEGEIKINSLPDQGTVTRITLPAGPPGL